MWKFNFKKYFFELLKQTVMDDSTKEQFCQTDLLKFDPLMAQSVHPFHQRLIEFRFVNTETQTKICKLKENERTVHEITKRLCILHWSRTLKELTTMNYSNAF